MPEDDADRKARAAALAQWSRLSDARFGDCYIFVCPPAAQDWTVITADKSSPPKPRACLNAAQGGFLDELARAVAKLEHREGRPPDDIFWMLDKVCSYGVMQGMTDQQKGFMSAEILLPLLRVSEACAIVMKTKPVTRPIGTAFLVAPDLVLTAAHVVLEVDESSGSAKWVSRLREGLAFRFKARPNQDRHHSVEVLPAVKTPLVAYALPHGRPPDELDLSLEMPAGTLLDFAIVRLAQRVDHVSALEVADNASVTKGKPCWAFGFPEGNGLMMDVDLVTDINEESGRWLHRANTAGGMSGACCVNHMGQVAGLHEGTVQVVTGGAPTRVNRGVSIIAIRRAQARGGKDLLKLGTSAQGLEFQDPALVKEFYRAGKRLGGEAHAARWRAQVAAALRGVDPEDQDALPAFHPWFARPELEKWIDSTDEAKRLCMVYGEAGVGKSFCARILREKLDPRKAELIAFNPTQLNALDWADAISQVLVPEGSDYRPAAASVRYRDFDEVLRELRRRSQEGGRACHVVMDFGPSGSAARFIGSQWSEFVKMLVAVEWIRVTLIGLDDAERSSLIGEITARPEVGVDYNELEVRHLKREEFRGYLKELAGARGWSLPEKDLLPVVNSVFNSAVAVPDDMWTVTSALAAIVFEAGHA